MQRLRNQGFSPGGRLEHGEYPFSGLKREVSEEVGLNINIVAPIKVDHFQREDNQSITMIIFLCEALDTNVTLSEEHTDFCWKQHHQVKDTICKEFHPTVDSYDKLFKK